MAQNQKKFLKSEELAAFFESMAMLLSAGISANECPNIIAGDMTGGRLSQAAAQVAAEFEGGEVYLFSEALQNTGYFPEYAVDMIRLGEESGRLDNTADSLGGYYRQQHEISQSVRSALSGPILLLVIMGVVMIFLLVYVLPIFEDIFMSLGLAANGIGGTFLIARIFIGVIGLMMVIVVIFLIMAIFPGGRELILKLAQAFPLTSKIHYAMSASRLTYGLEMMSSSGVSMHESLEKSGILVTNESLKKKIPPSLKEVEEGGDIGRVLAKNGVFSGYQSQILISASRSGQMESALKRLSELYAQETEEGIGSLLGMMEPALVGMVSIFIGAVLLSIMMPLTRIIGAF